MNFSDIDHLLGNKKVSLAICMPEEVDSITAAYEAYKHGFVNCIFVGNTKIMQEFIDKIDPEFKPEMINAERQLANQKGFGHIAFNVFVLSFFIKNGKC